MKTIKTVGVIGAGTMGSALAQKFAQEGFEVILADRELPFAEKGLKNIESSLQEAVSRKVFTQEQVKNYLGHITLGKIEQLALCDLVVEAVFEDFKIKTELFGRLSGIVRSDCIIATNTSSFSVTELSASVKNPSRFIGLHFFYHAAKNRLVEIIPGEKTSEETLTAARHFAVMAGKDPIECIDAYGFVVNRFFVPWLNEAVKLHAEGIASKETIDRVCMETFGVGMGPFALMNATGVPVAYHAEKTLEVFGNLYIVANALREQAGSGRRWELAGPDNIPVDPRVEKKINDRMLGLVFFVCSQILEERVCTATHLNRGARIGLKWKKGPVELMRAAGQREVLRLAGLAAKQYGMRLPASVGERFWTLEYVSLRRNKGTAVITMDQPESLNALSEETVKQLAEVFDKVNCDEKINTIYITGSGKAFVAGADIKFFVNNIKAGRICDIESFTAFGQDLFDRIDKSSKKIVAVLNGLALGGGLELALCADVILALPKAQMGFPETGIGIYPGLGGTQRSVRKIGKGLSKYLIYSGKIISAVEAEEIGLVDKIITTEEMFRLFAGESAVHATSAVQPGKKWKALEAFFAANSVTDILNKKYAGYIIAREEAESLMKNISYKAPVALKLAEKLINEEKGCISELDHLREIFSTSDALLGLTSVGKKVQYTGK